MVVKRKAAFRFAGTGKIKSFSYMSLFFKEFVNKRNFVFADGDVSFSPMRKTK